MLANYAKLEVLKNLMFHVQLNRNQIFPRMRAISPCKCLTGAMTGILIYIGFKLLTDGRRHIRQPEHSLNAYNEVTFLKRGNNTVNLKFGYRLKQ